MSMPFLRGTSLRMIIFAFLLTFFSSFGQTFFVGLFGADIRAVTGLDDGSFGTLYSLATLASAICMFWAGALIDRVRLPVFTTGAALIVIAGCLSMMVASTVAVFAIALFLVRFGGQGLLAHTGITSTARFFTSARGTALSFAILGLPAGQALLPPVTTAVMASDWATLRSGMDDWRTVWFLAAGILVLVLPLLLFLCRRADVRTAGTADPDPADDEETVPSATRGDVLRDLRFYLFLPTLLIPPFLATGIFIHQARFVAEKGWDMAWFAVSFTVLGVVQILSTLASGNVIDRISARRLMPLYLLPLGAACVLAALADQRLIALLFMAGIGMSVGGHGPITNAMWAEVYGTRYLGAIRALVQSLTVASTALAPALFGVLIELDVTFGAILLACAIGIVIAALMARLAAHSEPPAWSA